MNTAQSIDITADQHKTVLALLERYLPNTTAWACGSRTNWTSRPQSDLDMVVFAMPEQNDRVADLREAFEESDLPFRVDLFVWDTVPEEFRKRIEEEHVVLVEKKNTDGDWCETSLAGLLSFSNGKSSPRRFDGAPNPVYGSNGIIGFSDKTNSTPKTIIVGRVGSYCGSLHYSDRICWITDNAIRANALDENDAKFLFYLLQTLHLNTWRTGSGQPLLNQTILSSIPTAVPNPTKQRAIAHILGTLDNKIELNQRMNETLEAMARALFKSWFIDFDPVRAKIEGRWRPGESLPGLPAHLYDLFPDRLVESELGEIPEGWRFGHFGDIVDHIRDKENPPAFPDTVFQHFSIPAFDKNRWPQTEQGKNIKSQKSRVPPGAILLSKLNPEIERVWFVDVASDKRAICSTEFLVLQARPPFQRSYVYCFARFPLFRRQIESLVTGTSKSHQRAQARAVLAIEATIPSARTIQAFDQQASALLGKSVGYRKKNICIATLRDTLLPRLISGELRVKDVEAFLNRAL